MNRPFDFLRFCRDHGVSCASSGHKHCQPGWIQVPCPFCAGNPGWHLGFNLQGGNMNCWRCGPHSLTDWISKATGLLRHEATEARAKYSLRPENTQGALPSDRRVVSQVVLPAGSGPLGPRHRVYLEGRDFDPDLLERVYRLQGTGPLGPYKYRIIAPIYVEDRLISYQGRDVTDRAECKYKACPKVMEVINHKETLYGIDLARESSCVVVEGITDVWRLGPGAVATFGIKFRPAQIRRLAEFRRVFVLFDTDEVRGKAESLVKAEQLAAALASLGIETELLNLPGGDPGELQQDDAFSLMRELGLPSFAGGI